MKYITLIIACYNGAKYVEDCFKKSHIDNNEIEYLFIDDGSEDNTLELAQKFAAKHKNVKVVARPHLGNTAAYDYGMKNAQGKYFFFLDIDDHLETDVILEALNVVKKHKKLDCVLFDYVTDFVSGKESYSTKLKKFIKPDRITSVDEFKKMPLSFYFMNHNILIRTDLMKEKHFVIADAKLYSDTAIVLFALVHSKQIWFINRTLYHYMIGIKGQTTTFTNTVKNYKIYMENMLFLHKQINCKQYAKFTYKRRKLIKHTIFLYICNIIFMTFVQYTEHREKDYIDFMKQFKKNSPTIYNRVYRGTILSLIHLLPKKSFTPLCKRIKKSLEKKIPWEEVN